MPDTLIIIGADLEQLEVYKRARDMGLRVVGVDPDPEAPAFKFADDAIVTSIVDEEETLVSVLNFFRKHPEQSIAGVMTMACDQPVTVATVAEHIGLKAISVESALILADNFLMKEILHAAGVLVPPYKEVCSVGELLDLVNQWGWPLILKPVDGRDSRGLLLLDEDTDISEAFKESVSYSVVDRLLVESYISGPQVSTESVMMNGSSLTPVFSDRNYELLEDYAPYVVENGGDMPSRLSEVERVEINILIERAALSMGLENAIVKGDIVIGEEGPYIINLSASLSGNYLNTDQVPLATGIDLIKVAIKMAVGEEISRDMLKANIERASSIRFFFPPEGAISDMETSAAEGLAAMPGVVKSEIFIKAGNKQGPIRSQLDRGGFVITEAGSREEAAGRAEAAIASITFKVE